MRKAVLPVQVGQRGLVLKDTDEEHEAKRDEGSIGHPSTEKRDGRPPVVKVVAGTGPWKAVLVPITATTTPLGSLHAKTPPVAFDSSDH